MRLMIAVTIAAAVMTAAPAFAQDTNNTAATAPPAAATTDMNATDMNATAPVATNDTVPIATATPPADMDQTTVADEHKSGFPWGVLGLLGLIGLIPRKNRS